MWTLNINEEKKLLMLKISDTLTLNELSEILDTLDECAEYLSVDKKLLANAVK